VVGGAVLDGGDEGGQRFAGVGDVLVAAGVPDAGVAGVVDAEAVGKTVVAGIRAGAC
jgi:hypothetical protein